MKRKATSSDDATLNRGAPQNEELTIQAPLKRTRSSPQGLVVVEDGEEEQRVLPGELVWAIMQWLGVGDLVRAQLVCRQWHAIINPSATSGGLWEHIYFRRWPLPIPRNDAKHEDQDIAAPPPDWKRILIERTKFELERDQSQEQQCRSILDELQAKATSLVAGRLVCNSPRPKKTRNEDDDAEEEEEEEEEVEEEEEEEDENEAEASAEQVYPQRAKEARKARKAGEIGSQLDLHSLFNLMKVTYKKSRNSLYREQLKYNLHLFLKKHLTNIHARHAELVDLSDQLQKALTLFKALQPGVLYRRIDIRIKRLDYISRGDYNVEVIVHSIATGRPYYISLTQSWFGDTSSCEVEEDLYWGEKPVSEVDDPRGDTKDLGKMKAFLFGDERAQLVTDQQMNNFLNAILNTGDIYVDLKN